MNGSADLSAAARHFIGSLGWGEPVAHDEVRSTGRHRIVRISWPHRSAALKLHAPERHAGEGAFERERHVHAFIAQHCSARVPALLAADAPSRSLLLEWIDGRKPQADDITAPRLAAMASFLGAINSPAIQSLAASANLPEAADAAWTYTGHAQIAQRRLARLLACPDQGPAASMREFVARELLPAWQLSTVKTPPDISALSAARILSPSDFGWHNTLITTDDTLRHLDFEHAGWDDPAKLAADFILQPEQPLPATTAQEFLDVLSRQPGFPVDLSTHANRLLPLQRIKWTTIILNPFLSTAPQATETTLLARLEKAMSYWRASTHLNG